MRISDYLIRPISTSTEPSGQYNLQLEAYNLAVNALNRMTSPKVDNATPCDVCRYNPPSSTDGKPCTMCPAEWRARINETDN